VIFLFWKWDNVHFIPGCKGGGGGFSSVEKKKGSFKWVQKEAGVILLAKEGGGNARAGHEGGEKGAVRRVLGKKEITPGV